MAALSQLSDAFIGPNVSSNWTVSSGTPTIVSGQLKCPSTISSTTYSIINSTNTYDLTGSYGQSQLINAGNQALASFQAVPIIIRLDVGNSLLFLVNSNLLKATKIVGGVVTAVRNNLAYDSTVHKYFRIREAGGTIFWDWSTDSKTWTNYTSLANPFAITAVTAIVEAGTFASEASSTFALFDNFNITNDYQSTILNDGPVAYWRLGESSGTTAYDYSNVNTGTYTGGFTLSQTGAIVGDPNTAVSFNGTTGDVGIADNNILKITGNISLEAWVNPTGATTGGIISRSDSTANLEGYALIYFKSTNNYFQFSLGSGTVVGTIHGATNSISNNTWYHVVGTWDGSNLRLYVNGVSAATPVAYTTTVAVATNAAKIGLLQWAFGPSFFTGTIDEVAIYNKVLTPAQVLGHYNAGRPGQFLSFM